MHFCHRVVIVTVALALTAAVVPFTASATDHVVDIQGISFIPVNLVVHVGDKVTWTNSSALSHTVTSGSGCVANGLFGSPLFGATGTFSYTFTAIGTVPYYCVPHCFAGMTGTVTVDRAVATENATWGAIKRLYDIEDSE